MVKNYDIGLNAICVPVPVEEPQMTEPRSAIELTAVSKLNEDSPDIQGGTTDKSMQEEAHET